MSLLKPKLTCSRVFFFAKSMANDQNFHELFSLYKNTTQTYVQMIFGAALPVEMIITGHLFPAQITLRRTAGTSDFIATIRLDETFPAAVALLQQRLRHFVLDVGPALHIFVLLDFLALERYVGGLLAQPAALFHAFRIEAPEYPVRLGGYRREITEGTHLQVLYPRRFHLFHLLLLGHF